MVQVGLSLLHYLQIFLMKKYNHEKPVSASTPLKHTHTHSVPGMPSKVSRP